MPQAGYEVLGIPTREGVRECVTGRPETMRDVVFEIVQLAEHASADAAQICEHATGFPAIRDETKNPCDTNADRLDAQLRAIRAEVARLGDMLAHIREHLCPPGQPRSARD